MVLTLNTLLTEEQSQSGGLTIVDLDELENLTDQENWQSLLENFVKPVRNVSVRDVDHSAPESLEFQLGRFQGWLDYADAMETLRDNVLAALEALEAAEKDSDGR